MVPYDVTIVGGGVIGCAIARELARYRLRVLVLEREAEVGFGTSKANSGIVHAGHHGDPGTLKGRLEWEGNQRWPALAEALGFGFRRIGELTLAFDEDDRRTLRELLARGQRKGVPGLELWSAERIRAEEPRVSPDAREALFAPTAAVINPYEACYALAESAARNGVELAVGEAVVGLEPIADRWQLRTSRRTIASRVVVNAAGLYADRISALAGAETFTLHARKGEEYLLDKRLAGTVRRLLFPCPTPTSKGILVIPTFDGTLMVGPTAHPASKDDLGTSATGAAEVFAGARRLVPTLRERDSIAAFAGLRAVLDDEDFLLARSRRAGLIQVAGIQSPGLTAAPAIAERVVELVAACGVALEPNADFVPSLPPPVRIASLATSELAEVAERDPRYARIACRCETVSEGEILDAIERGARTLDGLKFRTRAGMGRCQGGFCTWRCLDLLARATGASVPSLTKRGGDSWIACPRTEEVPHA